LFLQSLWFFIGQILGDFVLQVFLRRNILNNKMADKKNENRAHTNDSFGKEEEDELNLFIKKKKIQNEVLEKIIDKLNSPEENKKQ